MIRGSRISSRIRSLIGGALVFVALQANSTWAQTTATQSRSDAQLEQLVAPIALYPDSLLSQILMAATYPLEVVAAARWSQANPNVTSDALKTAMAQQSWDPSVKALTAVPQTLQMMSDKLDWTQQLGDAFLAQQSAVLDAVQRLRARADANDTLKSTAEQKVTTTTRSSTGQVAAAGAPATIYTIEPTNPDEYYVPIYDPGTVYGAWPYSDYEPFYWYPPGYAGGRLLSFAAGALAGSAIWGNIDWNRNRVGVNPLRYNSFNRTNITDANWNHNPAHRGNVPYRDAGVAQRFGNHGQSAAREAFRNRADTGRQQLGQGVAADRARQAAGNRQASDRTQAGDRNKGANRSNAGNRQAGHRSQAGDRNKVANRSNAGNRQGAGNRQAGNNQAGRSKQAARSRQSGGSRQAARQAAPRQRSAAGGNSGMRSRAQSIGGGGMRGGGGGGMRMGGGGRGGGRRSDIRLKHDLVLLGHLDSGIGFYRFAYNGGDKAYVGVLAQEVQDVLPQAVTRDRDGYLRVYYDKLGLTFETYARWLASGAQIPHGPRP